MSNRKGNLHVVRVLANIRSTSDVTPVELLVKDLLGVLLGLLGGVWVIEVGLVTWFALARLDVE